MVYKKILLLIGLMLSFSGCAQKAMMENMMVKNIENVQYDSKFENAIDILSIWGGKETNPAWTSQINSIEFKKALVASLIEAGIYSNDGQYKLKVEMLQLEQPLFGFDLTVTMTVRYTLLDFKNSSIVFVREITRPYTATMGDAFIAITRLKLANEGSARENIKALLNEFTNR